jgi:DNA repair exonuclease SbcCD nuclease subunit
MSNLFKKAMVFTDLHLGLKNNSEIHNEDCLNFVIWMVELAKKENCETCLFLGDFHHSRTTMNLKTMNYAVKILELLSKNFEQVYFIPGNHDLYYRDRRDVHGAEWAKHIPNIHIMNDWFKEGDVSIVPWLIGDDHKKIAKLKTRYVFGHFELPHFMMNAMVAMPDHGEINATNFQGAGEVYSGHFHMRQHVGNVHYIGNCFPHNFADAGDDKRGATIIDFGEEPVFHAWPNQPLYRVMNLSDAIDQAATVFKPNMHVRLNLDIGITYEEANFIKETFIKDYKLREVGLLQAKKRDISVDLAPGDVKFESVDQIVAQQITAINSEFYDSALLMDIYNNL